MSGAYEFGNGCRVTGECFGEDGESDKWTCIVPSSLLWSSEGMAELFKIIRAQLADPANYPGDENILESWNSFHLVSIEETGDFVLDIDWEEPAGV